MVWLKFAISRSAARRGCDRTRLVRIRLAVVRACVQALTGDEAQDYLFFAGRVGPSHWDAAASSHMLNSMLARMFTSILGLSAFSVRIPASDAASVALGLPP